MAPLIDYFLMSSSTFPEFVMSNNGSVYISISYSVYQTSVYSWIIIVLMYCTWINHIRHHSLLHEMENDCNIKILVYGSPFVVWKWNANGMDTTTTIPCCFCTFIDINQFNITSKLRYPKDLLQFTTNSFDRLFVNYLCACVIIII